MDVSVPIATIIHSRDGPVLAALASTTAPLGLTEVQTRAGRGSKSGARTVLLRMLNEGVVRAIPGGYLLNRDHIAAPTIELLASLHGELISRIRKALERWPIAPQLVGLFGSAARRDGDADSDIDVLVVMDDPNLDDRIDLLAEQIRRWTGNRAHVIGRTPSEIERLRKDNEPIFIEWTENLVVIAGQSQDNGPRSEWLLDGEVEDPDPTLQSERRSQASHASGCVPFRGRVDRHR